MGGLRKKLVNKIFKSKVTISSRVNNGTRCTLPFSLLGSVKSDFR